MTEFPRVSCRIRICGSAEVVRQYGPRFGQLMERVSATKFTPEHYKRLADMRGQVEGKRLEDCADFVDSLDAVTMRLLVSAAPLFNLASTNTKAYILVALCATA